jgi:ADP-ribosylation factor-like protein 1
VGPGRAGFSKKLLVVSSFVYCLTGRYFYEHTQAIIYVVDSADKERLPQARDVLMQILATPELATAVVAVFCNKQDLHNSLGPVEISQALGLTEIRSRPWSIFKTSAVSGEGLREGISWYETNCSVDLRIGRVATTLKEQQAQ